MVLKHLSELNKIADMLDDSGLHKEADELDNFVRQSAREYSHEVWDYIDGLKWHLKDAILNEKYPGINEKTIGDFLNILDVASGKRPSPKARAPEEKPTTQKTIILNPREIALAQLEMEKSRLDIQTAMKKIYDTMERTQNPAEVVALQKQFDTLKYDLNIDEAILKQRRNEAQLLKERHPEDYKLYLAVYQAGKKDLAAKGIKL